METQVLCAGQAASTLTTCANHYPLMTVDRYAVTGNVMLRGYGFPIHITRTILLLPVMRRVQYLLRQQLQRVTLH